MRKEEKEIREQEMKWETQKIWTRKTFTQFLAPTKIWKFKGISSLLIDSPEDNTNNASFRI